MKLCSIFWEVCFLCFSISSVVSITPHLLLGQTARATVLGVVKDTSGAVIPKAAITVLNQATGVVHRTTTSASGNYVIPALLPGTYSITASKSGFQTRTETGEALTVTARLAVNFTLPLGQVTQQVTVSAAAVHLDTASASLGQVIDQKSITTLPLNGRDFVQLTSLGVGTTPVMNSRQDEGSTRVKGETIGVNVSGGRGAWTSWLLDGVETKQSWYNTPSILPSVDSIQEFKVMTTDAPAQFGDAQAFVNVVTKSGTNNFHGDAYEFLRNNHLDARNFFDHTTPPYKQNQFGGTIGGPVIHNQLFFFFGYEGLRTRQGGTIIATVPQPEQLAGNFSDLSTPIIDPQTLQPFPGNNVPKVRFSKVASNFESYIPAPDGPGLKQNLVVAPSHDNDYNEYLGRMDYNLSSKDLLFGRYIFQNYHTTTPSFAPLFGTLQPFSGQNFTIQETHTFGPTVVNSFKAAFNRGILLQEAETAAGSQNFAEQLGLSGIGLPHTLSAFDITGFSGMGGYSQEQGGTSNSYQYSDDLTLMEGKHEISTGVEARFRQFQNVSWLDGNGSFSFDGRFTTNPLADFLLGLPASATAETGQDIANLRSKEWGAYIEDDYKATNRLTLNLGLRWEFIGPWSELNNKEGVFDSTFPGGRFLIGRQPSDFGITFAPELASRFVVGGITPGIVAPRYNDWAPRAGLAYQILHNTVLRMGYGIFYVEPNGNEQSAKQKIPPFSVTRTLTGTPSDPVFMDDLFPAGAFLSGILSPQGGLNPHAKTIHVQQWSFSIQQKVHKTFVQLAYVGTAGTHLDSRVNLNQAVPSTPGEITPVQARRPYPLFGDILTREFRDRSHYDALEVKVQQPPWHGLSFISSYTYSKAMDTQSRLGATEHQDMYDLDADMGLSAFDMRNVFNFSYSYELPFGQGKALLSKAHGILGAAINGWQVNGITTLLAGLPFNPTAPGTRANVGGFTALRANCLSGVDWRIDNPGPNEWFNTAAFAVPAFGTFGTCGRDFVIGPGTINFDFSAFKTVHLTERSQIEFRAEFFNLFNHPNFGLPVADVTSPNFGAILDAQSPREIQFGLKLLF